MHFIRVLLCWLCAFSWAWGSPVLKRELVFDNAPFPHCHAVAFTQAPDGTLLCAWFSGSHEKNPDTGVWLARYVDGAWTTPREIANGLQASGKRYASWNPVLTTLPDGKVVLMYRIGESPRQWDAFYRVSDDNGQTWGTPQAFPENITGPVRNPPLYLPDGRIVLPSSKEFHSTFGWDLEFDLSDDGGKTWTAVAPDANGINAIQPALLRHENGRLQALARTRSDYVATTYSDDNGQTWTPLTLTPVQSPNAGIAAIRLRDGRFAMVHNSGPYRNRLVLSLSDNAQDWRTAATLRDDPDPSNHYSYPTIFQTVDGNIHVLYSWRLQNIAHDIIDPAAL